MSPQYRERGRGIGPTIESRPDMSRFMSGMMSKIDALEEDPGGAPGDMPWMRQLVHSST